MLINLPEIAPHAADFARAGEQIGRWFDARAWWRLAVKRDPSLSAEADAALVRLAKAEPPTGPDGQTLAAVLGPTRPPQVPPAQMAHGLDIPTFVDEAERRGLVFNFENGMSEARQLPETMSGGSGGVGFRRRWMARRLRRSRRTVSPNTSPKRSEGSGPPIPARSASEGSGHAPPIPASEGPPFGDRLFKNRGNGQFDDVTAASGLAAFKGGYGHGVAVGDYDNDGRPDLFITRFGSYALYHNLGKGRFEDVTAKAGFGGARDWPTSAAWVDLDNDGDLDLYVCHYLRWDAEHPTLCDYPDRSKPGHIYCGPSVFLAEQDHVFRNDGGRFVDVTEAAGIVDRDGRGLGVVAADLDDDGQIDLFVANDMTANYLLSQPRRLPLR